MKNLTITVSSSNTDVASILHGEPDFDPRRVASISQVNYQVTQDRIGKLTSSTNGSV